MNTEDKLFSRARLGKHWTPTRAKQCLEFFPKRYRFNHELERQFRRDHLTDYSEHLTGLLEKGPS